MKLEEVLKKVPYDPKKGDESAYVRYLRYVVDEFYGLTNEEVKAIWMKAERVQEE